jgi:hypothetical protein
VPTLPLFRADSFAAWSLQARSLLMAHGLLDVVETGSAAALIKEERQARALQLTATGRRAKQEAAAPASGTTAAAAAVALKEAQGGQEEPSAVASPPLSKHQEVEMARSKRAYGALMGCLGAVQLRLCQFVPMGDAHGVWCILLENYERCSVTTRVQLIEKFFAMKQGSGEAVNVYVARLQETEHRLKEQGEEISGTMALFVLLRGATSRFPTLVTLLKMREDLTFDVLRLQRRAC